MSNLIRTVKTLEHLVKANGLNTGKKVLGNYDCLLMVTVIKAGGEPQRVHCTLGKCHDCPLALTRGWHNLVNETKLEELLND